MFRSRQRTQALGVIEALRGSRLHGECPCCSERIRLSKTEMFYLDEFPPTAQRLIEDQKRELAERAAEIKALVANASVVSTRVSKSVNRGHMLERLAPCFAGFPCGLQDCRHLGDPIDYVAFNGLTCAGRVDSLIFLEVKSGAAQLNGSQAMVQRAVKEGRVAFDIYSREGQS